MMLSLLLYHLIFDSGLIKLLGKKRHIMVRMI